MNYQKMYDTIIERRKVLVPEGYTEEHHIVPRSFGGTDEKSNLVPLTAREHFICHLLLTKIHKEGSKEWEKAIYAFMMMMCKSSKHQRITSRGYEKLREAFSRIRSKSQKGVNNSQYGTRWVHSMELKRSMRIKKEEPIPEGWAKGRVDNFDMHLMKLKVKQDKINAKIKKKEEVGKLYEIYKTKGFRELCEITGYNKTQENLHDMFFRYVDDYTPYERKKKSSGKILKVSPKLSCPVCGGRMMAVRSKMCRKCCNEKQRRTVLPSVAQR